MILFEIFFSYLYTFFNKEKFLKILSSELFSENVPISFPTSYIHGESERATVFPETV